MTSYLHACALVARLRFASERGKRSPIDNSVIPTEARVKTFDIRVSKQKAKKTLNRRLELRINFTYMASLIRSIAVCCRCLL